MKTIKNLLVLALIVISFNTNAQITVQTTGAVAIGATNTLPANFYFGANVRWSIFGVYPAYGIKFDCGNANPRIWSPSGSIVFYNNDIGAFQDIQVRNCLTNSDARNKTNINSIGDGLNTVKKLRGVSYNWKVQSTKDGNKQSYGLIAQEVEQVIKDAVSTDDSTGNKMVSYNYIIPYLVEAIKDLSAQVDALKKGSNLKNATSQSSANSISTEDISSLAVLEQNAPNPWSQNTQIGYFLPETVKNANIYVYDMNGLQIKNIVIQQTGKGSVTINGAELRPGMYIYALVADGNEVGTKRMILTQ